MELQNKVAIVTGAGRGIGEGIALAMAREGANIVVMDMNLDDANNVVRQIEALGRKGLACKANVTKKAEIDAMVAATIKQFGTIDILVNNAGIEGPPTLLVDLPEDQWDRVVGVNLKGVFLCCQGVLPTMVAKNQGKIVTIASTAAVRMTFFGSADYTASKHGVAGLCQHLAWEVADHRINVNVVCPGGVLTPLMEHGTTPEFREQVSKRLVPLGRFCTPDEIGQAVIFLASARSDMITGQMLNVDGGLLTGFGEDLRPVLRQRIADAKAHAAAHPHP